MLWTVAVACSLVVRLGAPRDLRVVHDSVVEALSTSPAQRLHLIVDSYTALCESLSARDRTQRLNTFHSQIDGYGIYTTDGDAAVDDVLRRWMKGAIRVEENEGGIETRDRRV